MCAFGTAKRKKPWSDQPARAAFRDCCYDTTLPAEAVESVAANLAICKSPTVLRQADGRLWGWEGCFSGSGCCHGTCTHVWNYAQSLPDLFPDLERTLRETECLESQDDRGHWRFPGVSLYGDRLRNRRRTKRSPLSGGGFRDDSAHRKSGKLK